MNAVAVGETDLQRLLAGLAPELVAQPRAIRSQPVDGPVPIDAVMLFREREGTTVVVAVDDTQDETLWAQITLRIHSSLEAVGMLAAIAGALAARDIPCNAVSAYYHDHLFVPWTRRDEAIDALRELSDGNRT
ncbi:MAG: ACT domain-containing protein [Lysobacter sp.]|nr:ACT domain-containing protein [Lysobacter sp.]